MSLSTNVNDLAARIATEFNTLRSEAGPTPVTISDTAPTDSSAFWYNSTNGVLYIKYDGFWVEAAPTVEGPQGPQGDPGAAGADGDDGVIAQAEPPSNTSVLWLDTDDDADILEIRETSPHPFLFGF